MKDPQAPRRRVGLLIVAAIVILLAAAGALGSAITGMAQDLADHPTMIRAMPRIDAATDAAATGAVESVAPLATPPAAPSAEDAAAATGESASGDGLTTDLGGSTIAASSVGGSNEVDRPGRRGKKK